VYFFFKSAFPQLQTQCRPTAGAFFLFRRCAPTTAKGNFSRQQRDSRSSSLSKTAAPTQRLPALLFISESMNF
jgi:hypothetical protein